MAKTAPKQAGPPAALSDLHPNPRNPRTITKTQLDMLSRALAEFGPLDGFVFNRRSGRLVSGHQRARVLPAEAAIIRERTFDKPTKNGTVAEGKVEIAGERFNYREVDWTTAKETAGMVAANQHGGEFSDKIGDLLRSLGPGYDLSLTGFDTTELLKLGIGSKEDRDAPALFDQAAALRKKWGVKAGQLWQVGKHRLLCGDSTKAEDVQRLLEGAKPFLCVTDPPYGVSYDPIWRAKAIGLGTGRLNAGRRMGVCENDDRADWLATWKLFPGDVIYSWHPAGHLSLVHGRALELAGFEIRMQIIWAKTNFPIGRGDYHVRHEPAYYAVRPGAEARRSQPPSKDKASGPPEDKAKPPAKPGKGDYLVRHEPAWYAIRKGQRARRTSDRTQSTLWELALDKNVDGGHSTQKPLECMARPIRNHEPVDVYDPFLGSGTTMVAAENLERRCFALEISPGYVAVCLERMKDAFGITGTTA